MNASGLQKENEKAGNFRSRPSLTCKCQMVFFDADGPYPSLGPPARRQSLGSAEQTHFEEFHPVLALLLGLYISSGGFYHRGYLRSNSLMEILSNSQ